MKRFILVIALVITGLFTQAQVIGGYAAFPKDSTSGSETKYLKLAAPAAITGMYSAVISITPIAKTSTETVSAILQGSYDGTNFFNITNATADSVKLNTAGVVKPYGWEITSTNWRYYRIKAVGYNAGVTTFTGGISIKRK